MIVIYRLCGIPSTNPSPIYQEDKFKLSKFCLRSFLRAFKDTDIKVIYLLDHCDIRYRQYLESIDRRGEIIETSLGINGTMLKAYELAFNQDEDILFQECDYFYLPDTGKELISGLNELGLVSPYDHPEHYPMDINLRLVNNYHWRSVKNNTMTFAIKNNIFKEKYDIFKKYGYLDHDVWEDIKTTLWTPIPSLATHMVASCLAPSIDWNSEFSEFT